MSDAQAKQMLLELAEAWEELARQAREPSRARPLFVAGGEKGTMSTRDNRFTPAAHRSGFEARQARANQKTADLAPTIAELQAAAGRSPNSTA
jgi:hypothetical protein